MRVYKETRICDRCKKELGEQDVKQHVSDHTYYYELCEVCNKNYEIYKARRDKLYEELDTLARQFQFDKYLPENPEGMEQW